MTLSPRLSLAICAWQMSHFLDLEVLLSRRLSMLQKLLHSLHPASGTAVLLVHGLCYGTHAGSCRNMLHIVTCDQLFLQLSRRAALGITCGCCVRKRKRKPVLGMLASQMVIRPTEVVKLFDSSLEIYQGHERTEYDIFLPKLNFDIWKVEVERIC